MKIDNVLRSLRLPLTALVIAFCGFLINMAGWYLFDSRFMAICGFIVGVVGIGLGFVGIATGHFLMFRDLFKRKKDE
jgi:hypothetical protein